MTTQSISSIDNELVVRAKSRVARWFDVAEQPADLRAKLLKGVESIARELTYRSDWYEIITVRLDDSEDLSIQIGMQQYRAFPCGTCLAITTIVPGWSFGWRKILKDEDVYSILSWFLHYARQYIHRSYVANVLMTIWERHQKVLHPFGSSMICQRYGPRIQMPSTEEALDAARRAAMNDWAGGDQAVGTTLLHPPWAVRNTVDPFLHQAVFHFLRGQHLKAEGFGPEAVVAFDCMIQTITSFVQTRCQLPTQPARSELCVRLGLNVEFAELAEYIYFLRNNFGAHAGGWRWWDQAELLPDSSLAEMSNFATQALSAAADFEPQVRTVEPCPVDWGPWLFENFEMLWDSVWFDKLDRWNRLERSNR